MEYIDLPQSKLVIHQLYNEKKEESKTNNDNCGSSSNNSSNSNSNWNDNSSKNKTKEKEKEKEKENNIFSNYDCKIVELIRNMGETIALLHFNDMIHGDLTTSNMLYDITKNKLYLIDFGLSVNSDKVEDKAVDLYVLERAFVSTHPNSQELVDYLLKCYYNSLKGLYESNDNKSNNSQNKNNKMVGDRAKHILNRLEKVRLRGRKRSMVG